MDEISVKVWGIAGDGSELIKASDAQAVISAMNVRFLALSNERDALAAQLVAVKQSGGTGMSPCANFCESVALKKDLDLLREHADKVKVERNAYAAQAGLLNRLVISVQTRAALYLEPNQETDAEFIQYVIGALDGPDQRMAQSSPIQCLAEIKAEAIESLLKDGFVKDYIAELAREIRKGGE